jgi:hypothetical protein
MAGAKSKSIRWSNEREGTSETGRESMTRGDGFGFMATRLSGIQLAYRIYGDAAERHKHGRRFVPVYAQTAKWRRPCASCVTAYASMSAEKTLLALPGALYEREQGEIRRRGYVSVPSDPSTRILRTEIRPFD